MEEDRIYNEGAKRVWMECGNNNDVPLPLESQIFMEKGMADSRNAPFNLSTIPRTGPGPYSFTPIFNLIRTHNAAISGPARQ
jgi:hypothetical protein